MSQASNKSKKGKKTASAHEINKKSSNKATGKIVTSQFNCINGKIILLTKIYYKVANAALLNQGTKPEKWEYSVWLYRQGFKECIAEGIVREDADVDNLSAANIINTIKRAFVYCYSKLESPDRESFGPILMVPSKHAQIWSLLCKTYWCLELCDRWCGSKKKDGTNVRCQLTDEHCLILKQMREKRGDLKYPPATVNPSAIPAGAKARKKSQQQKNDKKSQSNLHFVANNEPRILSSLPSNKSNKNKRCGRKRKRDSKSQNVSRSVSRDSKSRRTNDKLSNNDRVRQQIGQTFDFSSQKFDEILDHFNRNGPFSQDINSHPNSNAQLHHSHSQAQIPVVDEIVNNFQLPPQIPQQHAQQEEVEFNLQLNSEGESEAVNDNDVANQHVEVDQSGVVDENDDVYEFDDINGDDVAGNDNDNHADNNNEDNDNINGNDNDNINGIGDIDDEINLDDLYDDDYGMAAGANRNDGNDNNNGRNENNGRNDDNNGRNENNGRNDVNNDNGAPPPPRDQRENRNPHHVDLEDVVDDNKQDFDDNRRQAMNDRRLNQFGGMMERFIQQVGLESFRQDIDRILDTHQNSVVNMAQRICDSIDQSNQRNYIRMGRMIENQRTIIQLLTGQQPNSNSNRRSNRNNNRFNDII